jgi:hypothetical protein
MVVVVPFCVLREGTEIDTTTFTMEWGETSRNQMVGTRVEDLACLEI